MEISTLPSRRSSSKSSTAETTLSTRPSLSRRPPTTPELPKRPPIPPELPKRPRLRTLLPKTPLPRTSSRLSSLKRSSTREDTADPIGSMTSLTTSSIRSSRSPMMVPVCEGSVLQLHGDEAKIGATKPRIKKTTRVDNLLNIDCINYYLMNHCCFPLYLYSVSLSGNTGVGLITPVQCTYHLVMDVDLFLLTIRVIFFTGCLLFENLPSSNFIISSFGYVCFESQILTLLFRK